MTFRHRCNWHWTSSRTRSRPFECSKRCGRVSSGRDGVDVVAAGKPAEAKAFIEKDPSERDRLYALLLVSQSGAGRRIRAALERVENQFAGDIDAYHIAELHAFRGEDDLAFEWLDRAFEEERARSRTSRSALTFSGSTGTALQGISEEDEASRVSEHMTMRERTPRA